MNRKVIATVLALALVSVFACPAVYAVEHGKSKECYDKAKGGKEWGFEEKFEHKAKMILEKDDELGLTDEQKAKVKALKADVKKEKIKKDAEIDTVAVDLKNAMWQDEMNVEEVNKLIDKKYDLKKEKAKYMVNACASLKNILTDEQKAKMKELHKKGCKKDKD